MKENGNVVLTKEELQDKFKNAKVFTTREFIDYVKDNNIQTTDGVGYYCDGVYLSGDGNVAGIVSVGQDLDTEIGLSWRYVLWFDSKPFKKNQLLNELSTSALFLENRIACKPAPLNEYDIECIKDVISTIYNAMRYVEGDN